MTPRRVLVVTTSYPATDGDPSGHFVQAEVRELARDGAHVVVVAPGERPPAKGNPEVHGVPDGGCFGWPGAMTRIEQRPSRALGAGRFVVGARRLVRQLGPFDAVVAHWIVPSAWPVLPPDIRQAEIVAHGSDVRLLERLPGRRAVVARLLARGATFRFVSSELRDRLALATGLNLGGAVVRPSPIHLEGVPGRDAARAALKLSDGRRVAVIVGRLVPGKRVDRAIVLAETRVDRIVVVGDGPERATLERAFPSVTFVGQVSRPEALAWIAAADLLVSASRDEGAPTVIREARALGVPVLCEAAGDVRVWAEMDAGIEVAES